jgi:hypothetical protein
MALRIADALADAVALILRDGRQDRERSNLSGDFCYPGRSA